MIRVNHQQMFQEFFRVLRRIGFEEEPARLVARLFMEASRDGVYSHGLNRFPRFIEYIRKGYVDIHARPVLVQSSGTWERWDGMKGPGNLNAYACMERAIDLAKENGMGCVAIKNSNHWMRGGSYGWQAVESGCIAICWTNTCPNLPAWGGADCRLGNNPLIIAVPRPNGHVVLDMAISQYSYGKMENYRDEGKMLPIDGGFDREGRLTRDPGKILESHRPLPIGFWKGSGLSLLLDLVLTLLSGGNSLADLSQFEDEYGLSQAFIVFDPYKMTDGRTIERAVDRLVDYIHQSFPAREGEPVYYPGERTLLTRKENLELGIPVNPAIWEKVLQM